ncbi:MAG: nodulation protein NodU, partial [Actinobacteria bacterium]|nr:nodulation protein NodU [Actinomycetota bacterium]
AELPDDPAAVRVAAAAQCTVQHVMVGLAALARKAAGAQALCVAGGVALNCVANGMLGEPVYVPPVPHDTGVALGAVWTVVPPTSSAQLRPDLGFPISSVPHDTLADAVAVGGRIQVADLDLSAVLDRLAAGQIGAIAQGRAEIGPRALGQRSIIALPRPAAVADRLNRLKGREPWRPFGPAVLAGHGDHWWEQREHLARYMVGAVPMTEQGTALAPAVRHVDGTTRPQLVRPAESGLLHHVLAAMTAAGLPPVLVNTSFNRRGEPIVNDARHAIAAFLAMDLEFLLLGGLLVTKPARRDGASPLGMVTPRTE